MAQYKVTRQSNKDYTYLDIRELTHHAIEEYYKGFDCQDEGKVVCNFVTTYVFMGVQDGEFEIFTATLV